VAEALMMKRIALIADIVSSTKISERASVQDRLGTVLEGLNRTNPAIASPYTITLGDEFQALFNRADFLIPDVMTILEAVYPERVRFAFGVGSIETRINPNQAIGMDGPAFHHARKAIEEIAGTRSLMNIGGLCAPSAALARDTLALVSHHIRRWKRSRLQMFTLLHRGRSVRDIAGHLALSSKTVYKAIDLAGIKVILRLSNSVAVAINGELGDE
jgi:hypothetical protein